MPADVSRSAARRAGAIGCLGMQKLTIKSCFLDGGDFTPTGKSFEVMINPAAYEHKQSVTRAKERAPGKAGYLPKFNGMNETISFREIVIDGTGVLTTKDVKSSIDEPRAVVYDYSGEKHEPPWVKLLWGNLIFNGCLDAMSVNYTLFKGTGEPLRAKVDLSFTRAMSPQEEAQVARRSSPDLSHRVEVMAGDTLPLLCYRVYGDSSYYREVASINKLNNFR